MLSSMYGLYSNFLENKIILLSNSVLATKYVYEANRVKIWLETKKKYFLIQAALQIDICLQYLDRD